jgi:uncharacterized protein YbaR (Trm112 family)/2-polyprenyl-3-methyl-5-hydroxy-6-metoxy-1,4-benzoquinol methylase
MQRRLLDILACPKCKNRLTLEGTDDLVREGELVCKGCSAAYPITNGIPRFVPVDNYASSFGYQWNKFRKEQIDSFNGTTLSADRLWAETGWTADELNGKWVLDVGCGAGRFLDAASRSDGNIVGVDISNSVDAAAENLSDRHNAHLVHASIYELPFREGTFDYCYCIGVVQHTPDTAASLRSIGQIVKSNGKIAVTIYPRKPWTKLYSKYWFRPITRRLRKETLLSLIETIMPIAFPVTNALFRIPLLGKAFMFTIPIANYVHDEQLTRDQRYAWAILDTFDMLSPYYDQPMTETEAATALKSAGVTAKRTSQRGLNLVGERTLGG